REPTLAGIAGNVIATPRAFLENGGEARRIYLCPHCDEPTTFHNDRQYPGVAPGGEVQHCPADVSQLYKEARNCVAASAYTGAVLCARQLLMNVAVSQGAKEGQPFISYIDHLADQGYVPPKGRGWVGHIRKKGNEATHEIADLKLADAEDLITFSEMLLKFIYEFPNRIPKGNDARP